MLVWQGQTVVSTALLGAVIDHVLQLSVVKDGMLGRVIGYGSSLAVYIEVGICSFARGAVAHSWNVCSTNSVPLIFRAI